MFRTFSVGYQKDEELSLLYNDAILHELSEDSVDVILASGPRSYIEKLQSLIKPEFNPKIYYLGEPIGTQYPEFISMFMAIEYNIEDVLMVNIDKGSQQLLTDFLATDFVMSFFWSQLMILRSATKNTPVQVLKAATNNIRAAIGHIPSSDIVSAISKSVSLINNLIDTEEDYWLGHETRTLTSFLLGRNHLISINNINEIVSYNYNHFKQIYESIKSGLTRQGFTDLSAIDDRISYQNMAISFSQQLQTELSLNSLPKILVWLSNYCLTLSLEYKRIRSYIVSVNLCVRALETYCQGLLVHENLATFDSYGRFTVGTSSVSGAGEVWKYVCNNVSAINTAGIDKDKITNIIRLRNSSFLGHGTIQCNEQMYNESFSTIKNCISTIDNVYAPPPKLFAGLFSYHTKNTLKNLDKVLAKSFVYELSIQEM